MEEWRGVKRVVPDRVCPSPYRCWGVEDISSSISDVVRLAFAGDQYGCGRKMDLKEGGVKTGRLRQERVR